MFRKPTAIFLVFFLIWGNAGFCLNLHYCETSEALSVMVNHIVGERCDEGESHENELASCEFDAVKSCCKKLEETLPSAQEDCCSNTEFEMKINDAFQGSFHQIQIQKQLSTVIFIPLADCFCHYTSIPARLLTNGNEPPDIPQGIFLSGQNILIQNCVYRI